MSYVKGHIGYLVLRNSHVLLEDIRVLLTIDRAVELTATGQLHAQQEKLSSEITADILSKRPELDAVGRYHDCATCWLAKVDGGLMLHDCRYTHL